MDTLCSAGKDGYISRVCDMHCETTTSVCHSGLQLRPLVGREVKIDVAAHERNRLSVVSVIHIETLRLSGNSENVCVGRCEAVIEADKHPTLKPRVNLVPRPKFGDSQQTFVALGSFLGPLAAVHCQSK
jgi:hypothetical protein